MHQTAQNRIESREYLLGIIYTKEVQEQSEELTDIKTERRKYKQGKGVSWIRCFFE